MKEIPQQVSESVRRRNPHLYEVTTGEIPIGETISIVVPKKRIRQSTKPLLNKLEQEWWDRNKGANANLFIQSMRFRLANGLWYKPDFVCLNWIGVILAWEIKGPYSFRGGFENLKMAASIYTQIKWILTWKEGDQWKEQVVLP